MAGALAVSLAVSLGMTIFMELIFALAAGKRGRDLALVCLVNVITNPVVVLVYFLCAAYTPVPPALLKAVLETAAVLTEAYWYRLYGAHFRRPLLFSLGANAGSFCFGEIISIVGG